MAESPRKPAPRMSGRALRALSVAAGLPVVDYALHSLMRKQMDLSALEAVRFHADETPFSLPRPLRPIERRRAKGTKA